MVLRRGELGAECLRLESPEPQQLVDYTFRAPAPDLERPWRLAGNGLHRERVPLASPHRRRKRQIRYERVQRIRNAALDIGTEATLVRITAAELRTVVERLHRTARRPRARVAARRAARAAVRRPGTSDRAAVCRPCGTASARCSGAFSVVLTARWMHGQKRYTSRRPPRTSHRIASLGDITITGVPRVSSPEIQQLSAFAQTAAVTCD